MNNIPSRQVVKLDCLQHPSGRRVFFVDIGVPEGFGRKDRSQLGVFH